MQEGLTDFRFLNISPHSFHLALPSIQVVCGDNMRNILYRVRWSPTSKGLEAYRAQELIDMSPQAIFDDSP